MAFDNLSVLSRLRRAVKKVKFMLNFNLNRWRLASIIGSSSSKHRLSFNDRLGLRVCSDIDKNDWVRRDGSSRGSSLCRTTSYGGFEDDVDKRAEMFIANFHRQLRIERQISLEVKYFSRGNSFEYFSP